MSQFTSAFAQMRTASEL